MFGRVIDGLPVVKSIGKVKVDRNDRPATLISIETVTIEGDLPKVALKKY